MNNQEADKQIEQMIAFIRQEAQEKAEEIRVKTNKEFMAEKLQIETHESIAVRAEHEKAKKNHYIQQRIEKSKLLTESRFEIMKRRDQKMHELRDDILKRLAKVASDPKYAQLVRFLIAQGLMTVMESHVVIQCRKQDLKIVKKELDAGIQIYKDTLKESTGIVPNVSVTIDEENFLPPAPVANSESASCTGGIVLTANHGKIICRNTLDARLDLALDRLKPDIRGLLFGFREKRVPTS